MYGSRAWIDTRIAAPKSTDGRLAVNLDIDNTSLATKYARGKAVAVTLRFVKYADAHGVAILFNTGRLATELSGITQQLRHAGYPVDAICGRHGGEGLVHGKQRCRSEYVARGLHDHRQRGQPRHRLHRWRLRARLPAAELPQPAGLTRYV